MHKINLHIAITTLALVCCLNAVSAPKLTIVVAVDGLNQENLQRMRSYWPQGGLRTLSEEAYQTSVSFPYQTQSSSDALATLLTGSTPAKHGITGTHYFSRSTRKAVSLFIDKNEKGIGTDKGYSPAEVLYPTIADHIRMTRGTQAKIYAIGIHPENTILLAGHSANACCWLDTKEQRWVSTSYYSKGLPAAADAINMDGRFAAIINKVWTPRMDINTYMSPSSEEKKKSFNYDQQTYLTCSPAANELVVELALTLQKSEQLGKDGIEDLLLLEMTCQSPKATSDLITTAEQEDMYLWLNQDLGYLMEQMDKRIGHDNYQILLLGIPSKPINAERAAMIHLNIEPFNVDRAAALTSTYLMAIYGHERWVDGGYGQSIFLNRTLIEQKRLSLETMQRQVANFITEFDGVRRAYPEHEAYMNAELSTALNKRATGDVVFTLQNDWVEAISPIFLWSGSRRTFPESTIDATEVINMIK